MRNIEDICFEKACQLINCGLVKLTDKMDLFTLTDLLLKLEKEKYEKNEITDKTILYNDEIVSIEEVGIVDTVDISVSGDNLFYCNGILTKNSFGLPATADFMAALISTDELQALNQIMVKQLKNRYADLTTNKRFVLGIDRSKMRLYDVEQSAQDDIVDSGQKKGALDEKAMNKVLESPFAKKKFNTSGYVS